MLRTFTENRLTHANRLEQNKKIAKRLKEVKPTISIENPFKYKSTKHLSKKDKLNDDICKYNNIIIINT